MGPAIRMAPPRVYEHATSPRRILPSIGVATIEDASETLTFFMVPTCLPAGKSEPAAQYRGAV
jgi:hypothetical protein